MGKTILVVEDNELNLRLFCDLLNAHGYSAHPVRDGRDALAKAREVSPDLIIMDIQLPHVSGLELIGQMKADHGGDRLCGQRRRGPDPRCGGRSLCIEADFGDQVHRERRGFCLTRRGLGREQIF